MQPDLDGGQGRSRTQAVFAGGVGILGGLLPASRAARLPIATALREA
jgi:ABC-type lipoprotein release transport system permease subunit